MTKSAVVWEIDLPFCIATLMVAFPAGTLGERTHLS
jgi:hypothetical protein